MKKIGIWIISAICIVIIHPVAHQTEGRILDSLQKGRLPVRGMTGLADDLPGV